MNRLDRSFYARDTLIVARDLLGCVLVHKHNEARVSGRIVEVEAYCGHDDLASHASRGKTPRTAVMFGQPGTSYVYFIYGRYWLFNVVAKPSDADYPAAVLIRSLEPLEGLDIISQNRQGRPRPEWTNGPARLTLALGINGSHNTLDLADLAVPLFIEQGRAVQSGRIAQGGRVGINVPEPWQSIPWRFWVKDAHISR